MATVDAERPSSAALPSLPKAAPGSPPVPAKGASAPSDPPVSGTEANAASPPGGPPLASARFQEDAPPGGQDSPSARQIARPGRWHKSASEIPRSADLLAKMILSDPKVLDPGRPDLEQVLLRMAQTATEHLPTPAREFDHWIYRLVVLFLGGVALSSAVGSVFLAARANDIPDILTALGAAAIGALAGLLAPSPGSRAEKR